MTRSTQELTRPFRKKQKKERGMGMGMGMGMEAWPSAALLLFSVAAASAGHGSITRWESCARQGDTISFTNFTMRLQGSIAEGTLVMEMAGDILKPIENGTTFEFKFSHMELGTEIAYRGPYDLCCDFFESTKCEWSGDYPSQTRTSGCPMQVGPFTAVIKRPMFIKQPGIYSSQVTLRHIGGSEMSCVRSFSTIEEEPTLKTLHVDSASMPGEALALVPSSTEEESVTGGLRGGALSKRKGDLEDKNAAGQDRVVDEKDRRLLEEGAKWDGVYSSISKCGPGCCCLQGNNTLFAWTEHKRKGGVRATLSVAGTVSEGSQGACKGLTRMNIRNFVVGKGGNYSVAEKVYCQGSCQTLRAVRRPYGEVASPPRWSVGISNVENDQCGEQVFVCERGACLDATE